MLTLYKSLTKLPDREKSIYSFDKNCNRIEKVVKETDRYLLVNARGDSIACTKKYLNSIGINANETTKKVEEVTDDGDEEDNNGNNSSPKNSGVNNNG